MRLRPVGRPSEITAVDTQLLRKLQENDAYSYLLQNRTGLDKQTVTSALKKLVSAKFIRGRAGRTSRNRHATFYSLHPLARELLDLNFDVGCHILRETLILERRYPKAPWRALFANSVKLYEFGHGVTLPTRKDSGIDKAVRFFHLQFLPGPPLPSDNILLNKRPPVSLEEAVGKGPYHFIDGTQMSPREIENRVADLGFSVTTYLGDAPDWIRRLDYSGTSASDSNNKYAKQRS